MPRACLRGASVDLFEIDIAVWTIGSPDEMIDDSRPRPAC